MRPDSPTFDSSFELEMLRQISTIVLAKSSAAAKIPSASLKSSRVLF